MIRSPLVVPGELFYTLARLAIHCNPLKGRNANIKPLYWINSVAIGITVCVFAHRVPWQMTAAYTQHRVIIGFLRPLPIAVPDSRELDIAK